MALSTGCSPYDLARLDSEHPDVFDEYVDLLWERGEASKRLADAEARKARVNRIFNRG